MRYRITRKQKEKKNPDCEYIGRLETLDSIYKDATEDGPYMEELMALMYEHDQNCGCDELSDNT